MKATVAMAMLLALAACDAQCETTPASAVVPPAAKAPPGPANPSTSPSTAPANVDMPALGVIGYGGFGPAPFGASEERVRMAWGKELGGMKPDAPGGCYYLMPRPRTQSGYRIAFMFEDDRFVRMDVDADDVVAPGGGRVGMSEQDIERLYAGHVQVQAHKYVEGGKYLRVPNPGGGSGVVLFETDAEGRVTGWRIGEPPQVDYVEGCS